MGPQSRTALIAGLAACGPTSPTGGDDVVDAAVVPWIDGAAADQCGTLRLRVRDFSPSTHPDFEPFSDSDFAYPGLVEDELGADGKPVYAHPGMTPHTAGPMHFQSWYRDTPGVNMAFDVALALVESSGRWTYDSSAFFPVDGMGYGAEGQPHNFHFTTEIHTTFRYEGGEVFTFTGDDDLWLFINGRLAIDLGGLHPALSSTVDLDASAATLGIAPGQVYAMDIFHAERHTDASNFHVETTIDCFVVP